MNERIKQLAVQARKYAWENETHWSADAERATLFEQKFAELIVRECAELFVDQRYMTLNPHEPFANERVRALKEHDKYTVKKIKKHFGVEE